LDARLPRRICVFFVAVAPAPSPASPLIASTAVISTAIIATVAASPLHQLLAKTSLFPIALRVASTH